MRTLLVALLATAALATPAAAQTTLDTLSWLQGCWILRSGERVVEEQWMAPRGEAMIGMSRTVDAGRLRGFELVLIHADSAGLAYRADPSGQNAAIFRATELSAARVVFENPDHDFPRQIGYESLGPDSLRAWIAGPSNGQTRRIPFPYARADCPGS